MNFAESPHRCQGEPERSAQPAQKLKQAAAFAGVEGGEDRLAHPVAARAQPGDQAAALGREGEHGSAAVGGPAACAA